jgi:hypothetical protein
MSHVVSKQDWASIDINTQTGLVFVQEDWFYTWESIDPAHPLWSIQEKRSFQHAVDQQIWKTWSNHIRLRVAGASDFARHFAHDGVKVNFDTRWVLARGNWRVRAVKVAPDDPVFRREAVDPANRVILLYTSGLKPYNARNDVGAVGPGFHPNPHEFGHTMRNPDEYGHASPNLPDTGSIMNVGKALRARHLQLLIDTLNRMMPQNNFQPWIT